MEIGISTFVDTSPDVHTGEVISHAQRLREIVEEIVLADRIGLDVYGVGEHHREDFAASNPAVVLAAAAPMTTRIRLTSAVTVLSSADPVRVFQDFATLDGLSNGRAEIMAGRGSFIESFPLFGFDLKDYEELFEENLELLLAIRASEKVSWRGGHRPAIHNLGVYPRPVQQPLLYGLEAEGRLSRSSGQERWDCRWRLRLSEEVLRILLRLSNCIKKRLHLQGMTQASFRSHPIRTDLYGIQMRKRRICSSRRPRTG